MAEEKIIRRIDDLGRIVIPKVIRDEFGIDEGTAFEIHAVGSDIYLKKYDEVTALKERFEEFNRAFVDKKNNVGFGSSVAVEIEWHIDALRKIMETI